MKALPNGYEQFGARQGEHDDLVLALSMACWRAAKVHPGLVGDGRYWRREGVEFYGKGRIPGRSAFPGTKCVRICGTIRHTPVQLG